MTTSRDPELNNGIFTSWLPLITPGPILSVECSSAIYYKPGHISSLVGFDPWYGQYLNTNLQCLPAEHTKSWAYAQGSTTLKLGPFACPDGWSTVTVSPINTQTTFLGCCPSEYELQTESLFLGSMGQCESIVTSGEEIVAQTGNVGSFTVTTATITTDGFAIKAYYLYGYFFAETSTLITPTSSTTETTSASSGTISAASIVPGVRSKKLNTGAKIGIGIGAFVGLVAIACLIVAHAMLKRRSRSNLSQSEGPFNDHVTSGRSELSSGAPVTSSLVGSPVSRKRVATEPVEMWTPTSRK